MKTNSKSDNYNHITVPAEQSGSEIIIGDLVSISETGEPVVDFVGNTLHKPLPAISTVALTRQHIGRHVAILFANGRVDSPVIMGLIHNPLSEMLDTFELQSDSNLDKQLPGVIDKGESQIIKVDGKRVLIEGEDEVVLKCGDASITLTKAGKVLIRGKYLLNRSDGVNRIMGGSVQVN